jgi:hypothetical protein
MSRSEPAPVPAIGKDENLPGVNSQKAVPYASVTLYPDPSRFEGRSCAGLYLVLVRVKGLEIEALSSSSNPYVITPSNKLYLAGLAIYLCHPVSNTVPVSMIFVNISPQALSV